MAEQQGKNPWHWDLLAWNKLSGEAVGVLSLENFKSNLEKAMQYIAAKDLVLAEGGLNFLIL